LNNLLKKSKTYFIVDDDIDDQQFLAEALAGNDPDCRCFTASNGQEAIDYLIGALIPIPDVIFLDLNMPVLNGEKFLVIIKQTSSFQHIPIIIYSTTSSEQEMQEMNKRGAHHFLSKTHSLKALREKLASIAILADHDLDIGLPSPNW
jgi:CheY-like chemotaxis protein